MSDVGLQFKNRIVTIGPSRITTVPEVTEEFLVLLMCWLM